MLVTLVYLGRMITGSDVIFFIDSMPALYTLMAGKSKVADLSTLAFGCHIGLTRFTVTPWFEYVESDANIADGGSRVGVEDSIARSVGIHLYYVKFPYFPVPLVGVPAKQWVAFWSDHAYLLW